MKGNALNMYETKVKIDGMMCGMCEAHVNDAVRREFPKVKKVTSSHGKGETVVISPEELDQEALKKAVEATVNAMEEHAQGGRDYDQKCFVCHSQCPEDARMLIDALEERFPKLKGKIRLCDIGTIIGSHSGPGTVAVFFMGDERPAMD